MACQSSDTSQASTMDDTIEHDDYTDEHRMVLQGMMSGGYLGGSQVKALFDMVWKRMNITVSKEEVPQRIQAVMRLINLKIQRRSFLIKSTSCELTGKMHYLFMITASSKISIWKFQKSFTITDQELLSRALTLMLENEHFCMGQMTCVNMGIGMPGNITVAQGEKFMNRMLRQKHFLLMVLNDNQVVTLGIRLILEMEDWISENFPDAITHCDLCRKIMLHGYQCGSCDFLLHLHCYKKYIKQKLECPGCSHSWKDEPKMLRRKQNFKLPDELLTPKTDLSDKILTLDISVKEEEEDTQEI